MDKIISELLISIIESGLEIVDALLISLLDTALYAEKSLIGSFINISAINQVVLSYALSLMVLKFVKKMFMTYIGWTEGDSDTNPMQLLFNFILAIAVAVSFSDIYDFMANITTEFGTDLLSSFGVGDLPKYSDFYSKFVDLPEKGLFFIFSILAFMIIGILIYFQFIRRGLEMLVLRAGVPFACNGLLDSDKGSYAPYIKLFIQNMFTTIVQIAMFRLSFAIMVDGQVIWGIASILMTLNTPKFLHQYMIQVGNGSGMVSGAGRAVQGTASAVSKIRSLIPK